jgi:transposase
MWTEITRPKYERARQRYASNLTEAEWAVIESLNAGTQNLGAATGDRFTSGAGRDLVHRPDRLGRKRHIVTDTSGLLVGVAIHPANIQDRDGAELVIEAIHDLFPWLRHLFADSVYNGPNLRQALVKFGHWTIEIVRRAIAEPAFHLLPRRWVVERTLAWLNRNRRVAKDFEASIASATAWIYSASAQLLVRRLASV